MSMRYAFLMSTGFSGSTLVSLLIGGQPRVIGFGDTYFFRQKPENRCTCGERYIDCRPRVAVEALGQRDGLPGLKFQDLTAVPTASVVPPRHRDKWPLRSAALIPALRNVTPSVRRRIFARFYRETDIMLRALEGMGEYDTYFDGCKSLVRLELLRSEYPGIRALHLVRHPGAYLYHFQRKGEKRLRRRLNGWLRYHERARRFADVLGPDDYRLVTYEEVVGRPAEFLRQMGPFLGIENVLDTEPVRLNRESAHVMGNKMRSTATEVLNMGDKWRGRLEGNWESDCEAVVERLPWLSALYRPR